LPANLNLRLLFPTKCYAFRGDPDNPVILRFLGEILKGLAFFPMSVQTPEKYDQTCHRHHCPNEIYNYRHEGVVMNLINNDQNCPSGIVELIPHGLIGPTTTVNPIKTK
jgi:hypothetical protein